MERLLPNYGSYWEVGIPAPGLMSGQVAVSRVEWMLGSVIVPAKWSKRASNVSVRKKVLVKSCG